MFVSCGSLAPAAALGDSATYYYDDLGRLSRVVKGTAGSIYSYDELGNLTSVSSATTVGAPPVISAINPDVLFVGKKLYVKIEGQNLLTTESVTSDNPDLAIDHLFVTDTEITATMIAASSGSATVTVTTAYGSSGLGVTLSSSRLTLSPGQLPLVPGSIGILTASIDPPLPGPLTINLLSSKPSVAAVPATLAIPASGSADFTVNALQNGVGMVSAGDAMSVVFVEAPFSGDVSGLVSGRVSVYIDDPVDAETTGNASPVSVVVDSSAGQPSTGISSPVSVYLGDSPSDPSTLPSLPVSVQIQQ
jgi:hypothetical protein